MKASRHLLFVTCVALVVGVLGLPIGLSAGQPPSIQAARLTADPLHEEVERAIENAARRYLSAGVHTPWQIMHGMLAFKQGFLIKHQGEKVRALDWISNRATYKGTAWFQKTAYGGRAHPYTADYAFEGHPNQFLAILAWAGVSREHRFILPTDETITVADLVRNAQSEVNTAEEITWTLWALSRYLEPDETWQNKYRQRWSIEHLVRIQTEASVYSAACGGTHGLFALAVARNEYLKTGRPLRGVWLQADQKIRRYIREAQAYQNRDGSFSSNYFQSGGYSPDFQTRLNTSGHTLEFLAVGLPEEALNQQWVRNGVHAVARDLLEHRDKPIECGSLYHAVDGLIIYRDRTWPSADQPVPKGG